MLGGVDLDDLRRALGGVVLESACLERVLRAAFGALVGSKYTAAVDGRMPAHALIEDCHHIARVHASIGPSEQAALIAALEACDTANKGRNRVIHDAWTYRSAALPGMSDQPVTAQAVDNMNELAATIAAAANALVAAITDAIGAESLQVDDELRLELGQDLGFDAGYPS
jgi:hypothetical protein